MREAIMSLATALILSTASLKACSFADDRTASGSRTTRVITVLVGPRAQFSFA